MSGFFFQEVPLIYFLPFVLFRTYMCDFVIHLFFPIPGLSFAVLILITFLQYQEAMEEICLSVARRYPDAPRDFAELVTRYPSLFSTSVQDDERDEDEDSSDEEVEMERDVFTNAFEFYQIVKNKTTQLDAEGFAKFFDTQLRQCNAQQKKIKIHHGGPQVRVSFFSALLS